MASNYFVGSETSINRIPFPSNPINPETGKVYTFEEIKQFARDKRERRALYNEIWGEYLRLYQEKGASRQEPNNNRARGYLAEQNKKALQNYTREYFPDLTSIHADIQTRLNKGEITPEQAIQEWDNKRARYMKDVVELELSKRKFARQMAEIMRPTPLPVQERLFESPSPYPAWDGENNPILTKKLGKGGGTVYKRRGGSRRLIKRKRRQTNRKSK